MYHIGIDASGSYSRMAAVDDNMRIVGKHAGGSLDIGTSRNDVVRDNLKRILREFNKMTNTLLNDCGGICIGLSQKSFTKENITETINNIFMETGVNCPVRVASDLHLILSSYTKGEQGVVVCADRMARGFAVDAMGNEYTCGGYGHIVDNEGGAYYIGMQAVRAALMAKDGRRPATLLTEKVIEGFGAENIEEVIRKINSDDFDKDIFVRLVPAVSYAALNADEAAKGIEKQAAANLFVIADTLIRKTGNSTPAVVIWGSVFATNEGLQTAFKSMLQDKYSGAQATLPKERPEMGAVFLAQKA